MGQVEWCSQFQSLRHGFLSGTVGIYSIYSADLISTPVSATPKAFAASLFDDPVLLHLSSAAPNSGLNHSPKWLCRPISISSGFGGQPVRESNLTNARGHMQSSVVHLRVVCTEPGIQERVENLRKAVPWSHFPRRQRKGNLVHTNKAICVPRRCGRRY